MYMYVLGFVGSIFNNRSIEEGQWMWPNQYYFTHGSVTNTEHLSNMWEGLWVWPNHYMGVVLLKAEKKTQFVTATS